MKPQLQDVVVVIVACLLASTRPTKSRTRVLIEKMQAVQHCVAEMAQQIQAVQHCVAEMALPWVT